MDISTILKIVVKIKHYMPLISVLSSTNYAIRFTSKISE
jgi:hypothetical protein